MPLFDMSPDEANNLVNFGGGMMQASGQPGASFAGAAGAGIQAMGPAALMRAETQSKQLQNQLIPYQINLLKNQAGLLGSLADDGSGNAASYPPTESTAPNPNSGGQPWSMTPGAITPTNKPSAKPVNNPGNLRPVGKSTGFQAFNTPQDGMDALRQDLVAKTNGSSSMKGQTPSLRNIIYTYAPPNENNTATYLENVSKQSGISPNQILTANDIDKILPFMVKQEGNGAMLLDNGQQRNIGQGVTPVSIPKPSKREMAMGLMGMGNLAAEQYKAEAAGPTAAATEQAKLPFISKNKEEEKHGENLADAIKSQQETQGKTDIMVKNSQQLISTADNLLKNHPIIANSNYLLKKATTYQRNNPFAAKDIDQGLASLNQVSSANLLPSIKQYLQGTGQVRVFEGINLDKIFSYDDKLSLAANKTKWQNGIAQIQMGQKGADNLRKALETGEVQKDTSPDSSTSGISTADNSPDIIKPTKSWQRVDGKLVLQ